MLSHLTRAVQMQGCWSPPCVRRGAVSGSSAHGPAPAEWRSPGRQAPVREALARQRAARADRSRSGPEDSVLADSRTGSGSCASGVHVVVAQGLGIGRKRFVSGEQAAQLQTSQDGDLLVYSSIMSSQSPSRMVA